MLSVQEFEEQIKENLLINNYGSRQKLSNYFMKFFTKLFRDYQEYLDVSAKYLLKNKNYADVLITINDKVYLKIGMMKPHECEIQYDASLQLDGFQACDICANQITNTNCVSMMNIEDKCKNDFYFSILKWMKDELSTFSESELWERIINKLCEQSSLHN